MVGIRKFEIDEGKVIFYLDSVGEEQTCFSFIIDPIIDMEEASPALITAYDYYQPERESHRLYKTQCTDETWLPEGVSKDRGPEPEPFVKI